MLNINEYFIQVPMAISVGVCIEVLAYIIIKKLKGQKKKFFNNISIIL